MNKEIKNIMVTIIIFILGGTLSGCNSKNETPSIIGRVTKLNKYDSNINVLVENEGTKKYEYDKASITITKDTKVYISDKKVDIDDIKEGQLIEVVFTGTVRESYPVQADAKIVTIVE